VDGFLRTIAQKKREITQGCAFSGFKQCAQKFRGYKPPKTENLGA